MQTASHTGDKEEDAREWDGLGVELGRVEIVSYCDHVEVPPSVVISFKVWSLGEALSLFFFVAHCPPLCHSRQADWHLETSLHRFVAFNHRDNSGSRPAPHPSSLTRIDPVLTKECGL